MEMDNTSCVEVNKDSIATHRTNYHKEAALSRLPGASSMAIHEAEPGGEATEETSTASRACPADW